MQHSVAFAGGGDMKGRKAFQVSPMRSVKDKPPALAVHGESQSRRPQGEPDSVEYSARQRHAGSLGSRRVATPSARPVIICFAGDVWDGRPHSRHYLMRRLAGRYEVLWVDGAFVRSLSKLDRQAWVGLLRKLRGVSLRTVEPHLHVLNPLPVPPAGKLGKRLRLAALNVQVRLALRRLKLSGVRVAWFSLPSVAPLLGRLGERASLFYYQDRYHEFPDTDETEIKEQISMLAARCDVSVASAAALADDLRTLGASPELVRHGVDLERFAGDPAAPDDVASFERPLVGYVGRVGDHMWKDAVLATADRLERGTVVLVGDASTDLSALEDHPRIELLGYRPLETMPAYMRAFDCCLVPFILDPLTDAVNPIKLREYLAAGRPVVSTAMAEVLPYSDVVSVADNPAEFAEAVVAVLADPDGDTPYAQARRRARVADDSWDAAGARIERLVDRLLSSSSRVADR
jgi:glycosyltransferase involved in cell wall biosynthesis